MKTRTIISTCMLSLFIWLFSLSQASAVAIVTFDNQVLNGTWTYSMTVENQDVDPLFDLMVDLPEIGLPDLATYSPTGWSPVEVGTDFIHWMADFGSEILSGDSLTGFYFTYSGTVTDDIGSIPYHTTTWHDAPSGGSPNTTCDGVTGVPSECGPVASVPEPATLLLILAGMMMLFILRKIRLITLN